MADENTVDLSDANRRVMRDMINYAKGITSNAIPENAVRWIVEILQSATAMNNFHINIALSSPIVQVDYNFSGQTADGKKKWEVRFSINADVPNPERKQQAHFGGEIYLNKTRVMNSHKWLPKEKLPAGRPVSKDYQGLEEYASGTDEKTFGNGDYAKWTCMSTKHRY